MYYRLTSYSFDSNCCGVVLQAVPTMRAWLLSMFCLEVAAAPPTLRLVQLLYRHGDRTPSHTFPTDPYRYHWKEGVEMLTPLGMQQHYDFGKYLRRRYGHLLPERYRYNDTLVRSTDNDRTILSALAQLRGLYSKSFEPNAGYPFTEFVPVHTVPRKFDQVMKMSSPCPAYKKLWKAVQRSQLWEDIERQNERFFAKLASVSGFSYVGIVRSFYIADVVNVWLAHNLSLPAWVTPDVARRLEGFLDLKQYLRYYTPEMARLRGGPLLGLMTDRMVAKFSGSSLERRRLLYSYSAHDSTVAAFLSVLGVFNRRKPPYVACVMLELHRKDGGEPYVRLLYRNDTHKEPMLLTVPECAPDCPLATFRAIIKDRVPADIQAECFPHMTPTYVALAFLVAAAILPICLWRHYLTPPPQS